MQRRSLSCQRGWRSGGSNLSIDTETICILILFRCARIHNNTGQLFKCACIEKSTERSTAPAAGKEKGFFAGRIICDWKRRRLQRLRTFISIRILELWQLWRKAGSQRRRRKRRRTTTKRVDWSASAGFCNSHVGVKEFIVCSYVHVQALKLGSELGGC